MTNISFLPTPIRTAFKSFQLFSVVLAALFTVAILTAHPNTAQSGQLFEYFWPKSSLDSVVSSISKRYPDIGHITTAKLKGMLENSPKTILVDVREQDEYEVSHLEGAIRIAPDADISQINTALQNQIKGSTVIFYCSVGERSSLLAELAKKDLMSQGASEVYNLSGGIFAWHNEKRNLVDTNGPTNFVHPFDNHWGRLVNRQQQTRMSLPKNPINQQSTQP